jgi:hypothetical protein
VEGIIEYIEDTSTKYPEQLQVNKTSSAVKALKLFRRILAEREN